MRSASSAEGWVRGHGQVWCGAESTVQGVQRTWVRIPVSHLPTVTLAKPLNSVLLGFLISIH